MWCVVIPDKNWNKDTQYIKRIDTRKGENFNNIGRLSQG